MKIVDYIEEYGKIVYPEGFKELLSGKSIEEQVKCFCISGRTTFYDTVWYKRTSGYAGRLMEKDYTVVVKDGLIAGIIAKDECGADCFIPPEKGICTYYDEENNGAGYKTRADYLYLVCVLPENIE
ncbi:MAG: hypothetical protein IKU13_03155 [Clostridia bacterium]|nr:hypothetical protein [Clostridia bacterium]MBR5265439.1 hypothetical protein [Clostridia bacterium]